MSVQLAPGEAEELIGVAAPLRYSAQVMDAVPGSTAAKVTSRLPPGATALTTPPGVGVGVMAIPASTGVAT